MATFDSADRVEDILQGHAEDLEPVGVRGDLVLDREPADAGDIRHARHGAELRADVPILDRAEPAQVEPAALDRIPEDLAGGRRVRRQLGHRPRGKLPLHPSQSLGHSPTRLGDRDAVLEDHADRREADVAGRPDHPDAADPRRPRVGG